MDGLDIFNVYVMGSIEMLTVFHFFTRFLKKKVKFIYYILFAIFGIAVIRIFTDGSIMELLVYVLLLMAGGFFICKTYNIFVGLYAVVMIEIMHLFLIRYRAFYLHFYFWRTLKQLAFSL